MAPDIEHYAIEARRASDHLLDELLWAKKRAVLRL